MPGPIKSFLKNLLKKAGYNVIVTSQDDIRGLFFVQDIKFVIPPNRFKTVFDVGANVGATAINFSKFFPDSKVFAFEPVPATFEILKNKTAHISRIQCFEMAIGSSNSQAEIYLQDNNLLNSLSEKVNLPANPKKKASVQVRKLDTFCEEQNVLSIDLLKMDTEGYEMEVVKGAKNLLDGEAIKVIHSEVGFGKSGHHTRFVELNKALLENGFHLAGIYHQTSIEQKYLDFANAVYLHDQLL